MFVIERPTVEKHPAYGEGDLYPSIRERPETAAIDAPQPVRVLVAKSTCPSGSRILSRIIIRLEVLMLRSVEGQVAHAERHGWPWP